MKTLFKVLIIFSFTFLWGDAWSREIPPPPGDPKPFELATPEIVTLDNGLEVVFVDFGFVPKVSISAVVAVGNKNEGENTWLSDITGELMKEGTATRSNTDIVFEAADMGSALNIGVGLDQSRVSMNVLSEFADKAIFLIADVLQNPAFPESELPRIKQNFLRNLSVARTQPHQVASKAFMKLIYGADHPYGRSLPDEGQIEGYSLDQIHAFYNDNFGAERTRIYVVGQFDRDALLTAIKDAFGGWTKGPPALDLPANPTSALRVKLIDRPGSAQSTIFLGLPVMHITDSEAVAFQVMHTLLGGAFSSRITKNIREDKGYSYSPNARIDRNQGVSLWIQVADVTTSVTGASLREIFYEIENLQDNIPSADEVDKVQNYLAGLFVLQNGSRNGIIAQLAALNLQGLDSSYLNEFVGRVMAVEDEKVSRLAREELPLDRMTLVVVGDLSLIEDQIKDLPELEGAEYLE